MCLANIHLLRQIRQIKEINFRGRSRNLKKTRERKMGGKMGGKDQKAAENGSLWCLLLEGEERKMAETARFLMVTKADTILKRKFKRFINYMQIFNAYKISQCFSLLFDCIQMICMHIPQVFRETQCDFERLTRSFWKSKQFLKCIFERSYD